MQPQQLQPPVLQPVPVKKSRKWLYISITVLVVAVGVSAWFLLWKSPPTKTSQTTNNTQASTQPDQNANRIRLIATGDWIAHDSVNAQAKQPNGTYDYYPMVSDFGTVFKQADIRFCNDPILNGGASLGIYGYPKFNSPTEFVTSMGKLGCNLVNTASNHSFDFTQANITNSVDAWSQVPNMLAVAGENRNQAEHDTVHYFNVKGVKFAFLAYTTYINSDSPVQNDYGVNVYSDTFAATQIATARQQGAQIIIASVRWGTEYSTAVDGKQKQVAQFLADQGVNLVLGHGAHELEPVAELTGKNGNKTQVWYGIGNFLNSQIPAGTLFNGIPVIDFDTKTLQITNTQFLPVYMHYEWTAEQAKAQTITTRRNLHLYLLEDANQQMIDTQQLPTTIAAEKQRMQSTLNANGLNIPLITSKQL